MYQSLGCLNSLQPPQRKQMSPFCMKTIITLQITGNFKLLGLVHDDRKPLADDAWITIGSRIRRVSFLHHI